MDSDSDDDHSSENGGNGIDLTGILFGNIDSEGRLVDDVDDAFDSELKDHLSSLSKWVKWLFKLRLLIFCFCYIRLGLNSMLNEVIEVGRDTTIDDGTNEICTNGYDGNDCKSTENDEDDYDGEIIKSPSAVDYSDIMELSEDCPRSPVIELDLDEAIPATKVAIEGTRFTQE